MNTILPAVEDSLVDSKEVREALMEYSRFVIMYNRHFNLTGAKDADDFYKNQILDSVAPAKFFKPYESQTVYDIGSGAGLPGIALALLFEKMHLVLVERSLKRSNFLRSAISHLSLTDRVEVLSKELSLIKSQIEVATFRALGAFGQIEHDLHTSLKKGGVCLCYKGRLSEAIGENVTPSLFSRTIEQYSFNDKERCIVFLKKL